MKIRLTYFVLKKSYDCTIYSGGTTPITYCIPDAASLDPADSDGGGDSFCEGSDCYAFPGGELGGELEEDKIIKDPSFENTKADCVYEKLLNLSGGFKNAIKKFDGDFPVAHLRFKLADLGSNVRGLTSPPENYVIDITLNNNSSTSGTEFRPNLLTAKTIIHEVIHAEIFRKMLSLANEIGNIDVTKLKNMLNNGDYPGMLDYYTTYGLNGFQHQQMAQHYRETIGRVLQEFDTGIALNIYELPQQKYMDFAWEGLSSSNLIAWQDVISPEECSRINGVIQNYIDVYNNQSCQ